MDRIRGPGFNSQLTRFQLPANRLFETMMVAQMTAFQDPCDRLNSQPQLFIQEMNGADGSSLTLPCKHFLKRLDLRPYTAFTAYFQGTVPGRTALSNRPSSRGIAIARYSERCSLGAPAGQTPAVRGKEQVPATEGLKGDLSRLYGCLAGNRKHSSRSLWVLEVMCQGQLCHQQLHSPQNQGKPQPC